MLGNAAASPFQVQRVLLRPGTLLTASLPWAVPEAGTVPDAVLDALLVSVG